MGFSHIRTSGPLQKRLNYAAIATPRAVDGEIGDSLAQIGDWRLRDRHKNFRQHQGISVLSLFLYLISALSL